MSYVSKQLEYDDLTMVEFASGYAAILQSRYGNLEEFFKFENHPWPPSLSQMGELRGGQKSDLVKCLQSVVTPATEQPTLDAIILDGAVIVQMLNPGTVRTFEEYCETVFGPYIARHIQSVKRVDLVFDDYQEDSLKKAARERRGTGQRRRVTPSTRIPSDWKGFLRVDENKKELFLLLANYVVAMAIPDAIDDTCLAVIERFIILLYDRTSNLTEVNMARQYLFSKKSRNLENIPPTKEALLQHIKRSAFQGGMPDRCVVYNCDNETSLSVTRSSSKEKEMD
ncbi:hypothetical protein QZH41_007370 [Actinostola sp. cb2023]|nr:hypothetical protein QZH41_007370 [Actinostola sp. cb2023]